jgi:metal-dependent amidase/aminoacylase/carboxypeptidase family protein
MASSTSVDLIIRGLEATVQSPKPRRIRSGRLADDPGAANHHQSRNSPLDPAVVTIGSIHGGTKRNIILTKSSCN